MKITVARILQPVHSLGPGERLSIWLQGCSIAASGNACPECISRDLWDASLGESWDTSDFAIQVSKILIANNLTGVTISGGEPTDQSDAICDVFDAVTKDERFVDLDWLVFSYYDKEIFIDRFRSLFERLDAFILGKYCADLSSDIPLIASSNQQMILRSSKAQSKFNNLDFMPRLQPFISKKSNSIDFVGVPRKGELSSIAAKLGAKGIRLENNTWEQI